MYLKKQIPAVILLSFLFFMAFPSNAALVKWVGSTSTDWNTASNWNPAATPTAFDTVVFDSGSNNCNVTGTVSMTKFKIMPTYTGVLTFDGATFTVSGDAALSGAVGDSLMLNPGSTAYFNVSGNFHVNYAVVFNINCSGVQGKAFNSRNAGTNANWQFMAPGLKFWDGSGIDNNWSTAENWMPDEIPTSNDSIVFDGTSNKACNLTSPASVKDLILTNSFTGSFDIAQDTITIWGDCNLSGFTSPFTTLDGGAFIFSGGGVQEFNPNTTNENPRIIVTSNSSVNINSSGNCTIKSLDIESGSTVNSPTSFELIIKDDFYNQGTFNHNNSIVRFDSTGGNHVIDPGTSSFFKLVFTGTASYQFFSDLSVLDTLSLSGATLDFGTGYTHSINHITSLAATGTFNINNSTINLLGNADFSNLLGLQWQENAVINCMGASAQTIIPFSTIDHPSISISNNVGVSFSGLSTDVTVRDLTINAGGVFTAPNTFKLRLRSSFINYGTFNHNNGIVEFDSTAGNHEINSISMFNILNINGNGASYFFNSNIQASVLSMQNGTLDMSSSLNHTIDTITSVAGSSTLNFNNSRVTIAGNLQLNNISSIGMNSDTLDFNGTASQNISAPASIELGHVLHSGAGTLYLSGNIDVSSFTQTDGILNMNTFDLNVQSSGDLTITKGSINGLDARQILVTGDANITGAPADSIIITPATVGYLNVTGSLNANYAVIGNVSANGSQGIAINSRDAGGNTNWVFPPATTVDLYFSVGKDNTNLLTSSSFSISNDTATFGTPQADKIGVGDRIDYDGGFSAYIKERISSTQYIIRKADGSIPDSSTVQADAIYRAFNSLSNALDSMTLAPLIGTTNLKAINVRLHVACYADSVDTTAVRIDGFETGSQNGIHIFTPGMQEHVGIPQDHHGKWSPEGYQLSVSGTGVSGRVLWIQVPHVKIEGLQIEYTGSNANAIQTISVEADSCSISNNIIRLSETTPPNQRMGISIMASYYTRIWNNLIYGFRGGSSSDAGIYTSTGVTDLAMPVYNNTIFYCETGINSFPNNTILAKNNLVYDCVYGYSGGTFATGSSNNLSGPSTADAPGTSPIQNTTVSFFDQGNGNFRLMDSSAAINAGVNLTSDPILALDDDITFSNRDASFDVGAYEYINTIPNVPIIDTFSSGETIVTNTVPFNIPLQFDLSDSDSNSMVKFHLQVDNNADFTSPEFDSLESVLLHTPRNNVIVSAMLNMGSYYWRVKTIDKYNASSSWAVANGGTVAFTIDGPDAPTNITLSNTTISENSPSNAVVGIFSSIDPDAGNTFSYSFFAGPGDSNNSSFTIIGDTLKTVSTFDYETQSQFSILVNSSDNTSLSIQKQFVITISNVNESPTDISLSDTTLNENLPASSFIGRFSVLDIDTADIHSYTFTAGIGDTHNTDFSIMGDSLIAITPFDYETKSTIYIRVKVTDAGGLTFEKPFILHVNNLPEDSVTQMPLLTQPTDGDTIHNFPFIDFTLPEAAMSGTVKMTFMQTGGEADFNSPHEITFGTNFEAAGKHTTTLNSMDLASNLEVDTVSSEPNDMLTHGSIYSVKMEYQDVIGNPVSMIVAGNVLFTDTVVGPSGPIITSANYFESNKKLHLTFNKPVHYIDSTKNFSLSTDNGITDTVIIQAPWSWNYYDTTKTTLIIEIPANDIPLLEGLPNKDSLELTIQDSTFGDSSNWTAPIDYSMNIIVDYHPDTLIDPVTNMFNLNLSNHGDTAIEAYLYFINDTIHDTASGILFNYGFGSVDIDTTITPWAFKDSSFIVLNTVQQGFWYFTWAPISLSGVIGEIKRDSILINNIKPQINLDTSYSLFEDSTFTLSNLTSDINGDSVNLVLETSPIDLVLDQNFKSITWTPKNRDVGIHTLKIKAIDSYGDTTFLTTLLTVVNTNDQPFFNTVSIPDTIYEDSIATGIIIAQDVDKDDSIKLLFELDSSWIKFNSYQNDSIGKAKFEIILSPKDENTGIKVMKYIIQDKYGSASVYFDTVFVVNTNDAPIISVRQKLINHGAAKISFKAEDDFDSILTFALTLTSTNMLVKDTNITGDFNYYPLEDNTYYISCTAIDAERLSSTTIDSFIISGSTQKTFAQSNEWDMITVPIENHNATSFKNGGTILHWDETKQPSNIYKYYTRESGITALTLGNSYFIKNSDSTIVISLLSDSLLKDTFSIVLDSGEFGWNQIGSPYTFPIKVSDSTLTFWEYDPSIKDYVDAQGILMPWKGYWIQTDESKMISLNPSPHYAGSRSRRSIARYNGKEDWIYTISLSSAISHDIDNYFGFSPNAKNGKDHFDRPEAPRMNDAPYLFFKQNEWSNTIKRFASDVRKKRTSEDFFNIGISGSSENSEDMKIKISGYQKNEEVYLFTRTNNGINAYEPGSEITINPSENDQYITVISSWKPELSIPLTFKTFAPYPNPCKPIANIKYTLPYSWEADGSMISKYSVKIRVYDVKGRVINELLNSKQKPGTHKVVWKGINSSGSTVASGTYFVTIDAGKHRATKKIMLIR